MSEPLRILIVDDEAPARARLKELLADCAADEPHVIVGECANAYDALAALAREPVDLALVDIHMPQMSGLEFARHAQNIATPPAIVFITAHDQYAVQAFELHALDYLLKPVRAARLAATLQRVRSGMRASREALVQAQTDSAPRRHLSAAERGRILLVPVGDILYLKAEQKYVVARTREREFLLEESLAHLEQEFGALFVRIHRNCLVARAAVRGFERAGEEEGETSWAVLLDGSPEKLVVSRRQWALVKSLAK